MTQIRTPMAPELTGAGACWFKSSYSDGAGNNCVEIADLTNTTYAVGVAIRDSKEPEGPALLFTPGSFSASIQDIRHWRQERQSTRSAPIRPRESGPGRLQAEPGASAPGYIRLI